ncbi:MAG: arsenic metallochaperone ArsD family protein [Neisseriaceae bacterium]|nr:arsenic metallochaperone ArsD family protein [Neisseriaceae bacterium]
MLTNLLFRLGVFYEKIQLFDPFLCCSSGVCGAEVDNKLVTFASDVDWAKKQNITIKRFNLAQQPLAFIETKIAGDYTQQHGTTPIGRKPY